MTKHDEPIRRPDGVLNRGKFLTLWDKAVGTPDYDKSEWRELSDMIEEGLLAREKLQKLQE